MKKALIMAAGYGTRLEPLTIAVPKPMVPVVNKPIMEHNIDLLSKAGIKDITANIHYYPEQIENYFRDGADFGVKLQYSYEEKLMGTAGGVWRMGRYINNVNETFVVLSSDALTDINLSKMMAYHKKKKAMATIALFPVEDPSAFGVVVLDDDKKVTAFQEKPKKEDALSNLVNAGIYVFEPEVLDRIPPNEFYDFGHQVFPELMKEKAPVYGYEMIEYWSDVGNLHQYWQANRDVMQGRLRLVVPGKRVSGEVWVGNKAKVAKSAELSNGIIIGDSTEIDDGVIIKGEAVFGDNCVIDDGAIINQCIIWSNNFIGKNCKFDRCVVGNWCRFEEGVEIGEGAIIGNRCRVSRNTKIPPGTKLKPNTLV
jgi:NDP-sugar pyrophosphorylase family protein